MVPTIRIILVIFAGVRLKSWFPVGYDNLCEERRCSENILCQENSEGSGESNWMHHRRV